MSDKQPTQKQIKEFWEWCGFRLHGEVPGEHLWYAPDGIVFNCGLPIIDLNNLFKYAFAKLIEKIIERYPDFTKGRAIHYLFQAWELELRKTPDFTSALFKVAQEVIHAD